PRLVNVAGDNALVTAYAAGRKRVGWRAIGEAVSDLRPSRSGRRPRRLRAAALAVAVVSGIAVGLVVSRLASQPTAPARDALSAVAAAMAARSRPPGRVARAEQAATAPDRSG